jgi:hypothetical protein
VEEGGRHEGGGMREEGEAASCVPFLLFIKIKPI